MCIDKKLFIIANKQLKYQSTDEWINKICNNGLWFSHKREWSTDIHYNIHVPWNTRYHWKYAKWRSSHKRPHFVWFLLKKMFRKSKIIATKSWLTVKLEVRMMTANGHQDTFWGDKRCSKTGLLWWFYHAIHFLNNYCIDKFKIFFKCLHLFLFISSQNFNFIQAQKLLRLKT